MIAVDEEQVLAGVRSVVLLALDNRRGLVAFGRLEARDLDQQARAVEREALEQIRKLLPPAPTGQRLQQLKTRLTRMDEALQALAARRDIAERSRALERDDITWRAFEDVSWLLEEP